MLALFCNINIICRTRLRVKLPKVGLGRRGTTQPQLGLKGLVPEVPCTLYNTGELEVAIAEPSSGLCERAW
ncbi:hypothetical protein ABBQ38_007345 [Trebouxia sp. C0009 RCD-2024]